MDEVRGQGVQGTLVTVSWEKAGRVIETSGFLEESDKINRTIVIRLPEAKHLDAVVNIPVERVVSMKLI